MPNCSRKDKRHNTTTKESSLATKIYMKNISKAKQCHIKPSMYSLIIQQVCIAADNYRLGEAVPIQGPATVSARRLGEAFAVFTFRYRSRSKSTHSDARIQCLSSNFPRRPTNHVPHPQKCKSNFSGGSSRRVSQQRRASRAPAKTEGISRSCRDARSTTDSNRLARMSKRRSRESSSVNAPKTTTAMMT